MEKVFGKRYPNPNHNPNHNPIHMQAGDYKLNVRCFSVFFRKHRQVFEASLQYQELPDNPSTPPRKRAPPSSLSSDSPAPKVKKKFNVSAELTESDDEE